VIPTNVTINSNSVRGRREAALQQANIGSGFYNLVNGQHLVVAQTLDVIDPVTGKAWRRCRTLTRAI
jgi:hypothetical protein